MRALTLVTQEEVDRAEEELILALERGSGTERAEGCVAVIPVPSGERVPQRVRSRFARQAWSAAATVCPALAATVGAAVLSPFVPVAWLVVPSVVAIGCAVWPGGILRPALGPLAGFVAAVAGQGLNGSVEHWSTSGEVAVASASIVAFGAASLFALAWPFSARMEADSGV